MNEPVLAVERNVAWRRGRRIGTHALAADVAALASRLPGHRYVINVCDDRYSFLVGVVAAAARGQITLLPPNRGSAAFEAVVADYPDTYCLTDASAPVAGLPAFVYDAPGGSSAASVVDVLAIPDERVVAIAFTSGSTGRPQAHPKTWRMLAHNGRLAAARFLGGLDAPALTLIGTVPHQHMYGLESMLMLPLAAGCAFHAGRPFFPADVDAAFAALQGPGLLVTTPVHLRALVETKTRALGLAAVLCSTAPLDVVLAKRAEAWFDVPLFEIYGCTESGAIASRRPARDPVWRAYDGVHLVRRDGQVYANGGHLSAPVPLHDVLQLRDAREFVLAGRNSEMVNIAGKRAALGDLNRELNRIEGVRDGVFFMPDEAAGTVTRLMAFVVAPELSEEDILRALRRRIDPAFMPRPLIKLAQLPREDTGKLARARLQALATQSPAHGALDG